MPRILTELQRAEGTNAGSPIGVAFAVYLGAAILYNLVVRIQNSRQALPRRTLCSFH
jgi:hypothetical protein